MDNLSRAAMMASSYSRPRHPCYDHGLGLRRGRDFVCMLVGVARVACVLWRFGRII